MDLRSFEKRKREHIRLSLNEESQSLYSNGLDRIQLTHEALPDLNLNEVSISQEVFGEVLETPFFVSSMTGGWEESESLNLQLAEACERRSWLMGVGSQRGELECRAKAREWKNIRKLCSNVHLMGNLGLSQLIETPVSEVERLVEVLEAKAMVIHLNSLQEALQKEGTPRFFGGVKALSGLVKSLSVPVVVKETGCGFSKETLKRLNGIGLYAVDLSGMGGTHWGRIEGKRNPEQSFLSGIGETFASWGITTADSLMESQTVERDYQIWASGGLQTGLDAAKALAMGAHIAGFGKCVLKALMEGEEILNKFMAQVEYALRVSLFCTGSENIKALQVSEKWKKSLKIKNFLKALKGFSKLNYFERLDRLKAMGFLNSRQSLFLKSGGGGLSTDLAENLIENVIWLF